MLEKAGVKELHDMSGLKTIMQVTKPVSWSFFSSNRIVSHDRNVSKQEKHHVYFVEILNVVVVNTNGVFLPVSLF